MDEFNPLYGTANLLDEVDSKWTAAPESDNTTNKCLLYLPIPPSQNATEKLMVLLRDGRTLIGYLRSVDQFANLVLHKTIERIHVGKEYGDIQRGIFIIRGENVVLLGEIDREREKQQPLKEICMEEILDSQRRTQEQRHERHRLIAKALKERGHQVNEELAQDEY